MKSKLLVIVGTLVVAIVLYLAPRVPNNFEKGGKKRSSNSSALNKQIDKALKAVRNSKRPMKGIMKLRKIANKNPQKARPQWELGRLSVQTGQHEKAIKRFEKVLELNKEKYPKALYFKGISLKRSGNYKKSIVSFKDYLNFAEGKEEKKVKKLIEEAKKKLN